MARTERHLGLVTAAGTQRRRGSEEYKCIIGAPVDTAESNSMFKMRCVQTALAWCTSIRAEIL